MTKPTILFHDVSKGEAIEREMTDKEYKQFIADEKLLQIEYEKEKTKENARQSALNKLINLGLTEEEAKAFLG